MSIEQSGGCGAVVAKSFLLDGSAEDVQLLLFQGHWGEWSSFRRSSSVVHEKADVLEALALDGQLVLADWVFSAP